LFAGISTNLENVIAIPYIGGSIMRISCTCGNTEMLSNKMENFEVHLIKFSSDSETGRISIVCNACGHESEEILIGN
jgi:hypothetical protein